MAPGTVGDAYSVRPLAAGSLALLDPLVSASLEEGFRFLARLRAEYDGGRNRFDGEGERLLGVFQGEGLVGVGGLNRDPYGGLPRTGRVRHVYVLPSHRRSGAGRALMAALAAHAAPYFGQLVLRTDTQAAARFYESLGYAAESAIQGATHRLHLDGRGSP